MREAVADESQPALLDILFNGIERFLFGDLHFGVGPARDFDDHVENTIALVSEQRNVVEGRDDGAILLKKHAMLCDCLLKCPVLWQNNKRLTQCVWRANKTSGIL